MYGARHACCSRCYDCVAPNYFSVACMTCRRTAVDTLVFNTLKLHPPAYSTVLSSCDGPTLHQSHPTQLLLLTKVTACLNFVRFCPALPYERRSAATGYGSGVYSGRRFSSNVNVLSVAMRSEPQR